MFPYRAEAAGELSARPRPLSKRRRTRAAARWEAEPPVARFPGGYPKKAVGGARMCRKAEPGCPATGQLRFGREKRFRQKEQPRAGPGLEEARAGTPRKLTAHHPPKEREGLAAVLTARRLRVAFPARETSQGQQGLPRALPEAACLLRTRRVVLPGRFQATLESPREPKRGVLRAFWESASTAPPKDRQKNR